MDCIFCKILNGDIPSNRVFEDDKFVAILDAFPANEGHTLVIPKKHFRDIFDIDEETLKEAYALAKRVAESIKKSLGVEDINILQNNGEISGQTVNHFHIHVIPRLENDGVVIKSTTVGIDQNRIKKIREDISINM